MNILKALAVVPVVAFASVLIAGGVLSCIYIVAHVFGLIH